MPDRDAKELLSLDRPHDTVELVILHDRVEHTAPPTDPVLIVSVIGDEVFLQIAEMEETNDTKTFKRIGRDFCAYGPDLARALRAFRWEK